MDRRHHAVAAAHVADQIAAQALVRVDGGLLAFLTLVQKAAIGLGAVFTGFALESSGFKSGRPQSLAAIQMIEALSLLVPAGGAIVAVFVFLRLSKALHQK